MENLDNILVEGLKQWNMEISKAQIKSFEVYKIALLETNKSLNLTAIEEEEEVYIKHFLDSISPLSLMKIEEGAKIIDVGTGAGFPALPMKIMRPDLEICLLDSLNKRVNFLKAVGNKLNLNKLKYIHARAEDGARQEEHREAYDYCVSRAVANFSTLLEYCSPYVKVGGKLVFLKGPSVIEEIEKATRALSILGCEILEIMDVNIPFTELQHKIVVVKKLKKTSNTYPRQAGSPSKKPL